MELKIGLNIKRFRKEKDITQEDFAQLLGVSSQSVSRWENGVCYPDMELLPTIAGFFGVTVDVLLGVDDISEKQRVDGYLNEFQMAIAKGNIGECIRIARAGVAEYPNNEQLLNKLMYALFVSGDSSGNIPDWKENMEKYDAEIVRLGERLAQYGIDADLRFEAIARLAFQHYEMGRKEKSREVFSQIPKLEKCRESFLWFALEQDEKLPYVREYINDSYFSLCHSVCLLAEEELIPDEEAVSVFQKMFAIDDIVFDGQRGVDSPWYIAESRFELAKVYARLGKTAEMLEALRAAADAALAFDLRPEMWQYSSLLLGERKNERSGFETSDTRPMREILRESWLFAREFDYIRSSSEFHDILQKLQ
ncbi:MAG: helix-turn-helix transcriptional regulator [Oscillospiraceae bacterium]|nr:helix-turn-helix transcriptional regulator [Oscillospiraceae bacterium]